MDKLSVQFNKDHLVNEFKEVIADAEALLKATANTGGEKLAEVRTKVQESIGLAKSKMIYVKADAIAKANAAAKTADIYAHDNPWRLIGCAAGIGVLVGLLAGRR